MDSHGDFYGDEENEIDSASLINPRLCSPAETARGASLLPPGGL